MTFPNWFNTTDAYKNFTEFLSPLKGKENLKFLQLGSFTGDASVWLLDNVLSGTGSHLDDVDFLKESSELAHLNINWVEVKNTYLSRTSAYSNVTLHEESCISFLKKAKEDYYDFIYVDASPDAVEVLINAELAWLCLKVGGIIAFDDYEQGIERISVLRSPQKGVQTFHSRRREKLSLVNDPTTQVWLKKESN